MIGKLVEGLGPDKPWRLWGFDFHIRFGLFWPWRFHFGKVWKLGVSTKSELPPL